MAQISQGIINAAIEGFEAQKRRIDEQIAELRALGNGHTPSAEAPKKRGYERRRPEGHSGSTAEEMG